MPSWEGCSCRIQIDRENDGKQLCPHVLYACAWLFQQPPVVSHGPEAVLANNQLRQGAFLFQEASGAGSERGNRISVSA